MKFFLLIVSILITLGAFSQGKRDFVVNIDTIPHEGYLLDKGWKFHTGDDINFSKTDFNDHAWQSVDPSADICDMPKEAQSGIGWLRIHVRISPGLANTLFLWIYQSPAIEVYVNGVKVSTKGEIKAQLKAGIGYFNKEPIFIDNLRPVKTIAVRYAYQTNLQYIDRRILPPLSIIYITDLPEVFSQQRENLVFRCLQCVSAALLFLLCLMHSCFYYFNTNKKENLYFALYSFFFCLFCLYVLTFSHNSFLSTYTYATIISYPFYIISGYWGIKALNSIFDLHYQKFFNWLIALSVVGVLIWVFDEKLQGYTYYIVVVLINLSELYFSVEALLKKKKYALVTTTGFLGGLLGVIGVVYLIISGVENTYEFSIFMSFAALSPALSISLLLSMDFAVNGQQLEIKLNEVKTLSAENLAKEAEKQQILREQNEKLELEVSKRTAQLSQSLSDLKSTQNQLIQSAKMASLGELTAGIAHEIQNPLNFVNNFSELSVDLLNELKEEARDGHAAEVIALTDDLIQNLEKINHHGKRAGSIVKGMLQHSRVSTGEKQKVDINILTDELVKLSYQGFRMKYSHFEVEIIKSFDPELPKAFVSQQDIGQVLVNLLNNAFYAVNQRQKNSGINYQPIVEIATASKNKSIQISVIDNGTGVSTDIKNKVMQPFFTTKPTGEGIGLGLSISHDIVVNGHGGTISVESEVNQKTVFIITLPET